MKANGKNAARRRAIRLASAVLILLVAVGAAEAAVVTLNDGSRLVGTIKSMSDEKLVLQTEFAGELSLDRTMVTGFTADAALNIKFESGDQLKGTVSPTEDGEGYVVNTALGDIPVKMENMQTVWPEGEPDPEVKALETQMAELEESMRPKWSTTFEAGLLKKEGNTDRLEARGRWDLRRKTDEDLLKFYMAGEYAEEDDNRTTSEVKGGASYEKEITERWYWFTKLDLEYDEFENLDLRSIITAGTGYYWIKQDDHELKTRAGLGYQHEAFNDGTHEDDMVGDLGLDYRLDLAPWLQFTHAFTYYPTFEELGDYRLAFDTAFLIPLDPEQTWKLKLGMTNDYDARPAEDVERLDNTYYANIVLELKDIGR
jgi:putative salt-induced outer membrane protein YdiY